MFFVEARYHRDPDRAGGQVRYIAHREEALTDGQRRDLYGIGERYRSLRGDERAIRKALRDDGRGLRNPAYFRFMRSTYLPCGSSESRRAGGERFSTVWSARSADSFELVRSSLIRRRLARAIAKRGLPCPSSRRARSHAATVSSSCSRQRDDHDGSRRGTAGRSSGCGSAGVASVGNRIPSERCGELCFAWRPGQSRRRCGMRCGYCVVSASAVLARDEVLAEGRLEPAALRAFPRRAKSAIVPGARRRARRGSRERRA